MSRRISEEFPTAFVTGSGSGLGRAFADMLLSEGVRVWGTSREPSRLGFASPLFQPVVLDLADADAAAAAFGAAEARAGGAFDLVINNAGYGVFGEFDEVPSAAWEAQIGTMLVATLRLTHLAYSGMRRRGRGCLVNVSSLAAEFPLPFMSAYNVAKAGLSALSESLLFETTGTGVRVIDFRPGDYRTSFNQAMQTQPTSRGSLSRTGPVWAVLEANLAAAPEPSRAAADLRRALCSRRRGIVRSGSFFQARLAPLLARLVPASAAREASARYFGLKRSR
jgi:NAD(P)-dependent dehydrogenase (short-subunit alcohol dehydrogenase family)